MGNRLVPLPGNRETIWSYLACRQIEFALVAGREAKCLCPELGLSLIAENDIFEANGRDTMVYIMAHSADWLRATTLTERVGLYRAGDDNEVAPREVSERAQKRMERWRASSPFNKGDFFNWRLAVDGLTEEMLLLILSEPEEALESRTHAMPQWLTDITEAFSRLDFSHDMLKSQTEIEAKKGLHGFLGVVLPLLNQGLERLTTRASAWQRLSSQAPFELADLPTLFAPVLLERVFQALSRTLVLELNVARLQGDLSGDTEEERFSSFVQRLRDRDIALALLKEYPVLARHVWLCINQWVDSTCEFLERLSTDAENIREIFCADSQLGVLEQVQVGVGDRHRNGRSVTIASFSSGVKLVYKPRSLDIEEHFQRLMGWLNERGNHPPFKTLRILNQGTYGWVEFIAVEGCTSEEEVQRFFERQGGYLALLYSLEATDFHFENLIASGEHPVLVDLEALFHPIMGFEGTAQSPTAARDVINHSVLRVGILPRRSWINEESDGVDLSGLGGVEGQLSPRPNSYLEGVGTDMMHVSRKHLPLSGGQNRPSLNDEGVDVLSYGNYLLQGFTNIYRLLLAHQDELLAEDGPLAQFANDEIRVLLRSTALYVLFLQDSFHPDCLRDALDRERLFDRLWVEIEGRPYLSRVIPCEREDLWNGDIPMFTTRPGACDLWSSSGMCIEGFFKQSSMSVVQQRIAQLSERDLEQQLWFIRASLTTLSQSQDTRVRRGYKPFTPKSSPEDTSFFKAAIDIGKRLEDLAFQAEDEVSWVGVTLLKDRIWSLQPLGIDLYDGTPGIALFLAYLGQMTQQRRHTELAEQAVAMSLRQLEQAKGVLRSIGAFDGWGGAIYAITHLGCLWQRADLLERADQYVELIPELIPEDKRFDVLGGAAGCISSLLGLYRITGSCRALEIASQCGDHLLMQAQPMEQGIGWVQEGLSTRPLTGFSHGNAGIAWALLQLWSVAKQERYQKAALGALNYERSLFSARARNWPDLRDPRLSGRPSSDRGENFMIAWCHGAPGIGLARLKSLGSLDASEFREDIDVALQTTLEQGFGGNHSLCHGDLGNLDFILEASRTLNQLPTDLQVNQLAAMVLESADRCGWLCGVALNVETPGLMTGLAGIGYEMLRLASPSEVPSVLTMEPPRPPFTWENRWSRDPRS
jgi:type 2 lantibiotic biosynthesis protein LanM